MWLTSLPNTRDLFIYDIATSKELAAVNLEFIESVTEADSFSWFFLQTNSNLFTSSTKKELPFCSSLLMESQFSYFPCCWDLAKTIHGRKGCWHVRRGDLWEKRLILVDSLRSSSYPSQQGIATGREGVVTKGALAGHKQKSGQDIKPQACGFSTVIPQPS